MAVTISADASSPERIRRSLLWRVIPILAGGGNPCGRAPRKRRPLALGIAACSLALWCCNTSIADEYRYLETPVDSVPALPLCEEDSAVPEVEVIAAGLEVPWDMAFLPDGRMLVTERPGRVRVIDEGGLRREPWAEVDVYAVAEMGMYGIAVDPEFSRTGHIYVMGSFIRAPRRGIARILDRLYRRAVRPVSSIAASLFESRVYRFTELDGHGVDARLMIGPLPANELHAGGALVFAPDGTLYASVGEALDSRKAQDPNQLLGKILRYRPDGTVPADNPFPGSPVFASGFRNVQGLAWHPQSGEPWATEHGPTGLPHEGRGGRDELNRIRPGGNYGWPLVAGAGAGGPFAWPAAQWTPAVAPSGLAFDERRESPWFGDAFLGALRGMALLRLEFDGEGVDRKSVV